jgi:hypothetical protein
VRADSHAIAVKSTSSTMQLTAAVGDRAGAVIISNSRITGFPRLIHTADDAVLFLG